MAIITKASSKLHLFKHNWSNHKQLIEGAVCSIWQPCQVYKKEALLKGESSSLVLNFHKIGNSNETEADIFWLFVPSSGQASKALDPTVLILQPIFLFDPPCLGPRGVVSIGLPGF